MSQVTPIVFIPDVPRPSYEVVDITPDKAREMLTYNTHNRNLRGRVVAAYAEDMRSGGWVEDGQSLKFAVDGALLDGQHRLAAIVEADTTVRMLVVRNLPNQAQENMDTQAKRTFSDVLKLRGEERAVALAAACRRVHFWEAGYQRSRGANITPTNRQLLQTLDKYPWLRETVAITQSVQLQVPIHGSILALCHWLFVQIDADDCDHFFKRLSDGVNLADGDPIHVLRRTVFKENTERARIADGVMLAYVIKAWNAFREGRKISILRYRPGGANPEQFPEPQ
jgi:hypothetical protein